MKCPQCQKKMLEGFIWLGGTQAEWLNWTDVEPSSFQFRKAKGHHSLMRADLFRLAKKNWVRKAYRCEPCRFYGFQQPE